MASLKEGRSWKRRKVSPQSALLALPDEVLSHVLQFCERRSLPTLRETCKHLMFAAEAEMESDLLRRIPMEYFFRRFIGNTNTSFEVVIRSGWSRGYTDRNMLIEKTLENFDPDAADFEERDEARALMKEGAGEVVIDEYSDACHDMPPGSHSWSVEYDCGRWFPRAEAAESVAFIRSCMENTSECCTEDCSPGRLALPQRTP